mmetsp:Transcript_61355/g.163105  ORF Transcript_61355/g.163105 Transcript_61355/m.163105 type:complete len:262 (-) Transcript_61355:3914-4699(-)
MCPTAKRWKAFTLTVFCDLSQFFSGSAWTASITTGLSFGTFGASGCGGAGSATRSLPCLCFMCMRSGCSTSEALLSPSVLACVRFPLAFPFRLPFPWRPSSESSLALLSRTSLASLSGPRPLPLLPPRPLPFGLGHSATESDDSDVSDASEELDDERARLAGCHLSLTLFLSGFAEDRTFQSSSFQAASRQPSPFACHRLSCHSSLSLTNQRWSCRSSPHSQAFDVHAACHWREPFFAEPCGRSSMSWRPFHSHSCFPCQL